jgi:hypothetical protein
MQNKFRPHDNILPNAKTNFRAKCNAKQQTIGHFIRRLGLVQLFNYGGGVG